MWVPIVSKRKAMTMKQVLMLRGASKLVDINANVQPNENVVVVTDYELVGVAEAMTAACYERGANVTMVVMQPTDNYGAEPSSAAAAAMKTADVIFTPVNKSITHSAAVLEALEAGARVLTLSDFTEDMLIRGGIEADFLSIQPLCDAVADKFTAAKTGRLSNKAGTDLTFSLEGRDGNSHSCVVRNPGELSGSVNIEANFSPVEGTAEGVIVADASIPNYGIGVLREPVVYTVRNGAVVDITGGTQANQIAKIMADLNDPAVYNIAQIAIGLNPNANGVDRLLEAHGYLGTGHVGIGTSSNLGGHTRASLHYDCILWHPTVELDGEVIQKDGEVLVSV